MSLPPNLFAMRPPPEDLAPYVLRYLHTHNTEPIEISVRPAPTGYSYIGWVYGGEIAARVNGQDIPTSNTSQLHVSGQIRFDDIEVFYSGTYGHVLAELTATGLYELMPILGAEARGRSFAIDASHFEDADTFAQGHPGMADEGSAEAHLEIFSDCLRKMAQSARPVPDFVKAAVIQIEAADGLVEIKDVADAVGVAQRHLTREFTRIVGVPPKSFALVLQLNRAIAAWHMGNLDGLADLAQAAGFYDQAHFNRTFSKVFQENPQSALDRSENVLFDFLGRDAPDG